MINGLGGIELGFNSMPERCRMVVCLLSCLHTYWKGFELFSHAPALKPFWCRARVGRPLAALICRAFRNCQPFLRWTNQKICERMSAFVHDFGSRASVDGSRLWSASTRQVCAYECRSAKWPNVIFGKYNDNELADTFQNMHWMPAHATYTCCWVWKVKHADRLTYIVLPI